MWVGNQPIPSRFPATTGTPPPLRQVPAWKGKAGAEYSFPKESDHYATGEG